MSSSRTPSTRRSSRQTCVQSAASWGASTRCVTWSGRAGRGGMNSQGGLGACAHAPRPRLHTRAHTRTRSCKLAAQGVPDQPRGRGDHQVYDTRGRRPMPRADARALLCGAPALRRQVGRLYQLFRQGGGGAAAAAAGVLLCPARQLSCLDVVQPSTSPHPTPPRGRWPRRRRSRRRGWSDTRASSRQQRRGARRRQRQFWRRSGAQTRRGTRGSTWRAGREQRRGERWQQKTLHAPTAPAIPPPSPWHALAHCSTVVTALSPLAHARMLVVATAPRAHRALRGQALDARNKLPPPPYGTLASGRTRGQGRGGGGSTR